MTEPIKKRDVSATSMLRLTTERRLDLLAAIDAIDGGEEPGSILTAATQVTKDHKPYLDLLKDLSAQALAELRIKMESENGDSDRAMALEIAKVISANKVNPFCDPSLPMTSRTTPAIDGPLTDTVFDEDSLSTELGSPDLVELMGYAE